MAKNRFSAGSAGMAPWIGIAIIVILLDQISKIMVMRTLPFEKAQIVTSFFNLYYTVNPGAAWSFLAGAGGWQRWLFTAIGVGAAALIIYLLKRHAGQRMFSWSMALILGGAVGNVIDRIAYGHVIDFLSFHFNGWYFPSFNVADSAICVGAVLFVIDELRRVNR
jgi:signal peptidase II